MSGYAAAVAALGLVGLAVAALHGVRLARGGRPSLLAWLCVPLMMVALAGAQGAWTLTAGAAELASLPIGSLPEHAAQVELDAERSRALGLLAAAALLLVGAWCAALGALGRGRRNTPVIGGLAALATLGGGAIGAIVAGWGSGRPDLVALVGVAGWAALAPAIASMRGAGDYARAERQTMALARMAAGASAVLGIALAVGTLVLAARSQDLQARAVGDVGVWGLADDAAALVAATPWIAWPSLVLVCGVAGFVVLADLRGLTDPRLGFGASLAAMVTALAAAPHAAAQLARPTLVAVATGGTASTATSGEPLPLPLLVGGDPGDGPIAGHCLVEHRAVGWQGRALYDPALIDAPFHPACPGVGARLGLPLPADAVPLVAAPAMMPATSLLLEPWFATVGELRLLVRDPGATESGWGSVPIKIVSPSSAVAQPLWMRERNGRSSLFVRDRYAGDLEDEHAATRLRVARTRAGAEAIRLVVNDDWTVQDLVTRCMTVRAYTAPDGPVACEAVGGASWRAVNTQEPAP
jgi:hypothetical protein